MYNITLTNNIPLTCKLKNSLTVLQKGVTDLVKRKDGHYVLSRLKKYINSYEQ